MADNLEDRIAADLKTSMLAKDADRTSVLRSLKSAFIYAKVAPDSKPTAAANGALTDDVVMAIVAKESKKRQESADAYTKAGQPERAAAELTEKQMIDAYLPASLSESEVRALIDTEVAKLAALTPQGAALGQIISAVKTQAGPTADGSLIARLAKERLAS